MAIQSTFAIDRLFAHCIAIRPGCMPGESLDNAGNVWPYNLDLRNSYRAREAIRTAPADLSGLSDDQLCALDYACIRRCADTCNGDELALAVHRRVWAEKSARAGVKEAAE